MIETTFDQAPAYETLSYVWGTTDRNKTVPLRNGKLLRITKLLKEALPFVETQCSTGYLWIDQICIDQDDRSERGQQVKLMGQIYTSCCRVLVWLGQMHSTGIGGIDPGLPEGTYRIKTHTAKSRLHNLRKVIGSSGSGSDSLLPELLQSPWFHRAWIFQEVVLPPSVMFNLATTSVPSVQALTIPFEELISKVNEIGGAAVENVRIMYRRHREQRTENEFSRVPIEQTLSHLTPRANTSEQLDCLYAFFGLNSNPNISFTPSYDCTFEVAMIATATAIIEGTCSLDLFEVVPRDVESMKKTGKIPSWTPDFRRKHLVLPFARSKTDFRQRAREAPELYPVFIPTHITYYRTTVRGSIYCAGEEKRTVQAHGFVLDYVDTEIGALPHRRERTPLGHIDTLLERSIAAWNNLNRKFEHKPPSVLRHDTQGPECVINLPFASMPTEERLHRALIAEGSCAAYESVPLDSIGVRIWSVAEFARTQVMHGRTLWMTRSGRFVLGSHLRRGDVIYLIYGCSNPVALRGEQVLEVLGTCYLEGWMDPWSTGASERAEEMATPGMLHII